MAPKLALTLCFVFIIYLFREDHKENPGVSGALWVPLLWMMILGSRYASEWLGVGVRIDTPDDYLDGSPLDRAIFLALMIAGTYLLSRRKIAWGELLAGNTALLIFVVYCGVSVCWSDYPLTTFKRFTKFLGTIAMVLIILTDREPEEALKTVIRRCGYVLIPLSIVLIKYFPDLGRSYNRWNWATLYRGVASDKNALGYLCLVCGYFFFWELLRLRPWSKKYASSTRKKAYAPILLLLMIAWLLSMAHSATSLMCLIVGMSLLTALGSPAVRRNTGPFLLFALSIYFLLDLGFDISQFLIGEFLERDATLTGRTQLWSELLSVKINPLLGTGYESFWLGGRSKAFWDAYWWRPNQAHNGYLEIYLTLGIAGLLLLSGLIFSAYRKSKRELALNSHYGEFRMGFLFLALLYNVTEAAFKGLHLMWFVFLIIAIDFPRRMPYADSAPAGIGRRRSGKQFAESPRPEPVFGNKTADARDFTHRERKRRIAHGETSR